MAGVNITDIKDLQGPLGPLPLLWHSWFDWGSGAEPVGQKILRPNLQSNLCGNSFPLIGASLIAASYLRNSEFDTLLLDGKLVCFCLSVGLKTMKFVLSVTV